MCEVNPKDIPRKSALNATSCANLDFHGMKCKSAEHVYGTSVHIINQKVLGCTRNHSDLLLYSNIGYPTEANKQCNHPRMSGRDMVKSAYRLCLPSLRKSIREAKGSDTFSSALTTTTTRLWRSSMMFSIASFIASVTALPATISP